METTKLQSFMEAVRDEAFDIFLANGSVPTAVFLILKNKTVCCIKVKDDLGIPEQKENLRQLIKGTAFSFRATAVVMVSEAWFSMGEDAVGIPPSQHPDRKECILVTGSNHSQTVMMLTEIIRDGEDIVRLGSTDVLKDGVVCTFTGFMREISGGSHIWQ